MREERKKTVARLERIAAELRRDVVQMIGIGRAGHLGGSCSLAEIVAALYFHAMRFDPRDIRNPDRDRFILSKGHAVLIQYAALVELGVIPREEIARTKTLGGMLQGHPDMDRTPGIEAVTGSLGQGLSIGVGMALALRLDRRTSRVYVILGDGELSEGQVWEAAMAAPAFGLDSLTAILDRNGIQATAPTAEVLPIPDVEDKWRSFGWSVGNGRRARHRRRPGRAGAVGRGEGKALADRRGHGEGQGCFLRREHGRVPQRGPDPGAVRAGAVGDRLPGSPPMRGRGSEEAMPYQNLREAWGQAVLALARRNSSVVALEADLGKSTRSILLKAELPERHFEMGIAEQNMVSTAAGLALAGKMPFVHASPSSPRAGAYDQLRNSVCIPRLDVRVCGSSAGLSDFGDGKTHQAVEDVALMRALPNMTVLCPMDGIETALMVDALEHHRGPAYVRINRNELPFLYPAGEPYRIGKTTVLREGEPGGGIRLRGDGLARPGGRGPPRGGGYFDPGRERQHPLTNR